MSAPTRSKFRHTVEYGYNTDTSGSNDTTSFHTDDGTSGVIVPNRTVGTAVTKRVRFRTPYTDTSKITIEWRRPVAGSQWMEHTTTACFMRQGSNAYGISWDNDATGNFIDVTFNAGGIVASNATYGGNGNDWATLSAAGYKWRARKEG